MGSQGGGQFGSQGGGQFGSQGGGQFGSQGGGQFGWHGGGQFGWHGGGQFGWHGGGQFGWHGGGQLRLAGRRAARVARRVGPVTVEDQGLATGVAQGRPSDPEQAEVEGLVALVAPVIERLHADPGARTTWAEAPRARQLFVVTASPSAAVLGEEVDGDPPVAGLGQAQLEPRVVTFEHRVVVDGQSWTGRSKAACGGLVDDGRPQATHGDGGALDSHGCRRDRGRRQLRQAGGDGAAGYEQPTGASSTARVPATRKW